jgi:tetratricopeptide (TPR) repeat protein
MIESLINKNYNIALKHLTYCLSENILMAEFWCLLGDIHLEIKDYKKAKEFYENAIILGNKRLEFDEWPLQINKYEEYPNNSVLYNINSLNSTIKYLNILINDLEFIIKNYKYKNKFYEEIVSEFKNLLVTENGLNKIFELINIYNIPGKKEADVPRTILIRLKTNLILINSFLNKILPINQSIAIEIEDSVNQELININNALKS